MILILLLGMYCFGESFVFRFSSFFMSLFRSEVVCVEPVSLGSGGREKTLRTADPVICSKPERPESPLKSSDDKTVISSQLQ
ncbi:hypothetical protein DPX16_1298 [Anabarilius grahami]|uniref:Uncharacterized protein n=1 Tax=Anabarilius grahami TaxID=495550 RepID=A0A3N0Y7C6_ANAGA|nr:hypothetical protein DPX16_1298 [Anabarilius grahami]